MTHHRAPVPRPARHRASPTADAPQNRKEFTSDQEVRWCPGCGDYAVLAAVQGFLPDLGLKPREHRVRLRHRLLLAVPLLPRHLRHALDPRPRPGDRHRPRHRPRGPVGLGRHRRRRRAVDRRQPPDPRAAPQREPDDPAVQQPDLRPHQGPVLPHLRARQGHQVHPDGLAGQPVQPGLAGARRRGAPSWPAPSTPTASTSPRCSPRPPPTAARRWWRSTRTARSSTTAPSTRSRTTTPRPTRSSRWCTASRSASAAERPARRRPRPGHRRRRGRRRPPTTGATLLVHDAHADDPTTAFALSRLTDAGVLNHAPIGIFRQVERRRTTTRRASRSPPPARAPTTAAPALAGLLAGGDTWTVV